MSEIAREAGALLMHYFHQHLKIEYKGDADLVTAADRAAEALIRDRIRQKWPTHDVLGEEQGLSDQGSEYRWYVDPLDGTTNFAHGYPVFCVSMGLEYRGLEHQAAEQRLSGQRASRVAAVVYDPTRDELFTAEQGRGARLNGEPIQVSKTATLKESLLATGFPSHKRHKNPNIFFYHQITLRTHGVRRAGSAALDLCNVASGRYDGFWEFNLNPWDTAAGVLIVEEAGGKVTRFDGSPFELNSRETVASNGLLHEALLAEFKDIFAGRGLEPLPDPREYKR
jgi:myo-inositol-1(or 4)-monophosphatase